jgi:hypothetical protein
VSEYQEEEKSTPSSVGGLLRRARRVTASVRRFGFSRWLEFQRRKLTSAECWFLAFRKKQQGSFWESSNAFEFIFPPAGHFYADPCLIKKDSTHYIFFEDYDLKTRKGTVACTTIQNSMAVSKPEVVLERHHHLSYPFVFDWQGELYMIPETCASRSVELYCAREFPRGWELVKILMEGVTAFDTTVFQHDGKCWMFTNFARTPDSDQSDLFLFVSESLLGPWRPHPRNPLISDVSRSRSAGGLFFSDGCLVRPSQDCSGWYGQAISLNRVIALSEDEFSEVPFARISPGVLDGDVRTHTLSLNEDWEVRDGFKWITKWQLPGFGSAPMRGR